MRRRRCICAGSRKPAVPACPVLRRSCSRSPRSTLASCGGWLGSGVLRGWSPRCSCRPLRSTALLLWLRRPRPPFQHVEEFHDRDDTAQPATRDLPHLLLRQRPDGIFLRLHRNLPICGVFMRGTVFPRGVSWLMFDCGSRVHSDTQGRRGDGGVNDQVAAAGGGEPTLEELLFSAIAITRDANARLAALQPDGDGTKARPVALQGLPAEELGLRTPPAGLLQAA